MGVESLAKWLHCCPVGRSFSSHWWLVSRQRRDRVAGEILGTRSGSGTVQDTSTLIPLARIMLKGWLRWSRSASSTPSYLHDYTRKWTREYSVVPKGICSAESRSVRSPGCKTVGAVLPPAELGRETPALGKGSKGVSNTWGPCFNTKNTSAHFHSRLPSHSSSHPRKTQANCEITGTPLHPYPSHSHGGLADSQKGGKIKNSLFSKGKKIKNRFQPTWKFGWKERKGKQNESSLCVLLSESPLPWLQGPLCWPGLFQQVQGPPRSQWGRSHLQYVIAIESMISQHSCCHWAGCINDCHS